MIRRELKIVEKFNVWPQYSQTVTESNISTFHNQTNRKCYILSKKNGDLVEHILVAVNLYHQGPAPEPEETLL